MPDRPLDPAGLWPSSPEEDHRSRDALDRMRAGFQIIGFDWKYLYVNPAAAQHGRKESPRDLVGCTMEEAYPGIEQTALFRELERCMRERQVDSFENEFTFPDGSRRWFELRVQPVPEGICIYSADIQARKLKELALAHRVAELEARSVFDAL